MSAAAAALAGSALVGGSEGAAARAALVPLPCGLGVHNLLTNGSFETVGPAGPYTLTSTYSAGVGPGSSAAAGWETFNDTFEAPVATSTDRRILTGPTAAPVDTARVAVAAAAPDQSLAMHVVATLSAGSYVDLNCFGNKPTWLIQYGMTALQVGTAHNQS